MNYQCHIQISRTLPLQMSYVSCPIPSRSPSCARCYLFALAAV